jgi:hypothetical protein
MPMSALLNAFTFIKSITGTVFMFLLIQYAASAQKMYIKNTDGTCDSIDIIRIQRINFEGNLMKVKFKDNSITRKNISIIDLIRFNESISYSNDQVHQEDITDINVSPNPTNDLIHYSFEIKREALIYVRLTDLSGHLLIQQDLGSLNRGIHTKNMDLSQICSGTYVLQVLSKLGVQSKLVIKN